MAASLMIGMAFGALFAAIRLTVLHHGFFCFHFTLAGFASANLSRGGHGDAPPIK
jgi:hypothetical protein